MSLDSAFLSLKDIGNGIRIQTKQNRPKAALRISMVKLVVYAALVFARMAHGIAITKETAVQLFSKKAGL